MLPVGSKYDSIYTRLKKKRLTFDAYFMLFRFCARNMQIVPANMLSGAVRNLNRSQLGGQRLGECLQRLDYVETCYQRVDCLLTQKKYYTKVPEGHHERILCHL